MAGIGMASAWRRSAGGIYGSRWRNHGIAGGSGVAGGCAATSHRGTKAWALHIAASQRGAGAANIAAAAAAAA